MFRLTIFELGSSHTKVFNSPAELQIALSKKVNDPRELNNALNWCSTAALGDECTRRFKGYKIKCISQEEASIVPIKEAYDWRKCKGSNNARSIICTYIKCMREEMEQHQITLKVLQSRFACATDSDKKEIQRVAKELNSRVKELDREIGSASAYLHRD